MKRGICTIEHLRERSIVDPLTGCWHWQLAKDTHGVPKMHTFCHHKGEKRTMTAPQAVWNIAHGESPLPLMAFRRCHVTDCVNPVHMARAKGIAEIGDHIRRAGSLKGTHSEKRKANLVKARLAAEISPTPLEVVAQIKALLPHRTGREIADQFGVSRSVVSRIKVGRSHKAVEAA